MYFTLKLLTSIKNPFIVDFYLFSFKLLINLLKTRSGILGSRSMLFLLIRITRMGQDPYQCYFYWSGSHGWDRIQINVISIDPDHTDTTGSRLMLLLLIRIIRIRQNPDQCSFYWSGSYGWDRIQINVISIDPDHTDGTGSRSMLFQLIRIIRMGQDPDRLLCSIVSLVLWC